MALAYLGLRPWELGELHLPEFWEAVRYSREEKSADRRHMGELIRGAALRLFNLQAAHPVRDPKKFWPMPWDEKVDDERAQAIVSMSTDERNAAARKFLNKLNNGKKEDNG